jgi:DNA-binding winged helix-turn-helix (wHTH) protein
MTLPHRPVHRAAEAVWAFGSFRLLASQRLLVKDGAAVSLGSRALEILTLLVERAGEVVAKDEIMRRVWPDTFVEEANVKVQVAAIRRALGDGPRGGLYVATIAGRGYQFVAPVATIDAAAAIAEDAGPGAVARPEPAGPLRHGLQLPWQRLDDMDRDLLHIGRR